MSKRKPYIFVTQDKLIDLCRYDIGWVDTIGGSDSDAYPLQGFDVQKALVNEQGRIKRTIMTDLELCHLIDDVLLPRYIKDPEEQSIYLLPISKRHDMGNILWHASGDSNKKDNLLGGKTVSPSQIRRCLAL